MNYGSAQMRRATIETLSVYLREAERLRVVGNAPGFKGSKSLSRALAFTIERAVTRELRRRAKPEYRPMTTYRR